MYTGEPAAPLKRLAVGPVGTPPGVRIRRNAVLARRLRYRRFHRARLSVIAQTVIGPHPTTIRGITLYGACLQGGRRLRRREMIALRLPSGCRVTARVRWRLGTWAGIMFEAPVADFARLISEGALVQSPLHRRRARSGPPRLRFDAGDGAAGSPESAVAALWVAVDRAWQVIGRVLSARRRQRNSDLRRFDGS